MSIIKDMFIEAHEELMAEYLEEHPDADPDDAYDIVADHAYERMRDNMWNRADALKDRWKYKERLS